MTYTKPLRADHAISSVRTLQHFEIFTVTGKMLSILRKARLKDKEMRILMLYVYF